MSVDFDTLRGRIKEAARASFTAIQKDHPTEAFYAFALYSDDGAETVCPAANSEEGWARRIDHYVSNHGERFRTEAEYLRWATAEWAYEAEHAEHFNDVCQILRDAVTPEHEFEDFRSRLFDTCINALADLDKEGFFGRGDRRKAVTLLFAVSDSNREHEAMKWAERLNPNSSLESFRKVMEPKRTADTNAPKPRDPAIEKKVLCPQCGESLRSGLAKQCFNCGADWH